MDDNEDHLTLDYGKDRLNNCMKTLTYGFELHAIWKTLSHVIVHRLMRLDFTPCVVEPR